MTNSAEPSTPSGPFRNSTTKATDHELQKYDNFTRYGHGQTTHNVKILLPFLGGGAAIKRRQPFVAGLGQRPYSALPLRQME